MKIDISCINHNLCEMVKEQVECAWDCTGSGEGDAEINTATLFYLKGAADMAEKMKQVLLA